MSLTKSIKIGTGLKGADDFKTAIENVEMKVGNHAHGIMARPDFDVALAETEIQLVVISLAELGLTEGNLAQIGEAARKMGLGKCTPEVGPQLRLQYPEQPEGEWLVVFMDPIADVNENPRMFHVGHNNKGRWLVADFGHDDHIWKATKKFVFIVLPQS